MANEESYLRIIEWFEQMNQPYDERDFKKIEDVQIKLLEIIAFAKSQELSEALKDKKWNNKALQGGVREIMDKELVKNNEEYTDMTRTRIENTSQYEAVADIDIDTRYESSTINELQELRNNKLREIEEEKLREAERAELRDIDKEDIPEPIRPKVQKIVEKKLKSSIASPEITAKTLRKREVEFRQSGFEIPQELKEQLRRKEVAVLGEARTVTIEVRGAIRGARTLEELADAERRFNENIELISMQKGGTVAVNSLRVSVQNMKEILGKESVREGLE